MKREDLPLVTPEKFKRFKPCWLETEEGRTRFRSVAKMRARWNALDILDLEDVGGYEKLWSVLREAFLPPMLLHEFGCRCAEYALSLVENPDPRSVEAIRVKRRWMAGEATDCELRVAQVAALSVWDDACGAAWAAARAAAWTAARDAAQASAWTAGWSMVAAARRARLALAGADERAAAWAAARAAAWEHEIVMLRTLIDEW